jgi:hypothetical protein
VTGITGTQSWNNARRTCAQLTGLVDLVRIRPRRNHIRQLGPGGAKRLLLAQQFGQLRHIVRKLPRAHVYVCGVWPAQ